MRADIADVQPLAYSTQWAQGVFNDRVVLITGANNPYGIGAEIARAFAALGAKVAITYLAIPYEPPEATRRFGTSFYFTQRSRSADETIASIASAHGNVAARELDLSCDEAATSLFDWADSTFGPVDILVNNASHYEPAGDNILEISDKMIDATLAVNVRATVLLMNEFAKRYKDRGATFGRIVSISTDAAQAFPTQIMYGASKASIEALTRSIAAELGPLGITVNAVAPGPIQTGYISPEDEERLRPCIPLRRIGRPNDIANAVLFLSAPDSSWITGQVVRVAGGHVM